MPLKSVESLRQLYLCVFVVSLGLGLYMYFIPVFAQTFGATFLNLGEIGSAYSIAYAATPLLVARLADRRNRAWLFAVATMINIIATILLLLATSVWDVVLLRVLGGFGFGFFWTSAEILVSDLAPPERRVREMGLYSASWASGILVGPLIGGVIIQTASFVALFMTSTLLIVVALIFSITLMIPRYEKQDFRGGPVSSLFTIRKLWAWYFVIMCYGLIFSVISSIFPGYANGMGISAAFIGVLFMTYGIVRAFSFTSSQRFLSFGEGKSLLIAATLATIATLSIAVTPSLLVFFFAMAALGICYAITFPLTIARIAKDFPNEKLGAAIGSYETVYGIGSAIGPLVAGSIAYVFDVTVSFVATSACGVLMAIFVTLGTRRHGSAE